MYPIIPTKLNAATITTANMAAPPCDSFLSEFDRPEKEWSIPFLPDSGLLFLLGAPEANACPQAKPSGALATRPDLGTDSACACYYVLTRRVSGGAARQRRLLATRRQRINQRSSGSVRWPWLFAERSSRSGGDQETPTSCFVLPLDCSNSADRWVGQDARRSFSNSA
jgi:hypothetical protein